MTIEKAVEKIGVMYSFLRTYLSVRNSFTPYYRPYIEQYHGEMRFLPLALESVRILLEYRGSAVWR